MGSVRLSVLDGERASARDPRDTPVKVGWPTRALAETCAHFADGDWVETKDQSANGVRLVQTGNVGDGFFRNRPDRARYVSNETFTRLRCTEIFPGDCLVSRLPDPVGRCCMLPDIGNRMITAVDCTIVRFDMHQIMPQFFVYYSQSATYIGAVNAQTTGTTRNRISRSKLGEIIVPVPSLPEQHRIVAILDEAFAVIAAAKDNTEKNLQNARDLFESYLQTVFTSGGKGWMEKIFSDVCEISSVLVDPRSKEYLELAHVGGANIASKTGELIELKTAREEGLISGKFTFDATMVLYSKIRPYLMKVARPEFRGLCSADIYPLSANASELDRDYLFYLLLSPMFTDYANSGSARAGMPKVNRSHLFAFRVHLPSVTRQKQLAAELNTLHEETKRLESLYRQKLSALDELKKSLLHQAFSGAL